ncbi:MAG: LamG domain-containing protein [Acidobacteriota bacterium]
MIETRRVHFAALLLLLLATSARAELVGFYTFEGNTDDVSGNGNDPTAGAVTGYVVGHRGMGAQFDGIDDFLQLPIDISPGVMAEVTMGGWVRSDVTSGNRALLSADDNSPANFDRTVGMDTRPSNRYSAFLGGGGAGVLQDTEPVSTTDFTFVAVRYDGTTVTLFVDDRMVDASDNTDGDPTHHPTTWIGKNPNHDLFFDGVIDEVFIYDEALTDAEVEAIRLGVVVSTTDWTLSTVTDPANSDATWPPPYDPIPAVGTFTLGTVSPPTGGAVAQLVAAADAFDGGCQALAALNDIRYYRHTFELDTATGLQARIRIAVDNSLRLFLNGQEIGREVSGGSWDPPYPELTIEPDGSITNVQLFDETFDFTTGWNVGVNEVIVAVRNTEDTDRGGFAFRMDFDDVLGACCEDDGSCTDDVVEADCDGSFEGEGTTCAGTTCPQPGACCMDDGSCTSVLEADCTGDFAGEGVSCVAADCPQPGACCLADGSCTDGFEDDCAGVFQGEDTECAMTSCPQPGACCMADGSCTFGLPAACAGVFQGAGVSCAAADCPQPGACCMPDGTCTFVLAAACSGDFQGEGVSCAAADCPAPGACCLPDGSCSFGLESSCTAGDFAGEGVSCAAAECPQPGACCFDDGTCSDLIEDDCLAMEGTFEGEGSDCATADCPEAGSCCFPDGTCEQLTEEACGVAEGVFGGVGTSCDPNPCSQPGACCLPDGSCLDIFEVDCLEAGGIWSGPSRTCDDGIDCTNIVPVPPWAKTTLMVVLVLMGAVLARRRIA